MKSYIIASSTNSETTQNQMNSLFSILSLLAAWVRGGATASSSSKTKQIHAMNLPVVTIIFHTPLPPKGVIAGVIVIVSRRRDDLYQQRQNKANQH
jgi:hypothetical protein